MAESGEEEDLDPFDAFAAFDVDADDDNEGCKSTEGPVVIAPMEVNDRARTDPPVGDIVLRSAFLSKDSKTSKETPFNCMSTEQDRHSFISI